ncbi:hypothetical protein QF032_002512 [Streptomyces achromogenes]|uniref:Uncharacterized protein n=1 Tax=Streptomyces achromogenes TaxID=67255 RepID=A0ABU0PYJ7_STRAH|nr:CD225/dispanin family protein [Streptomyces achromogenes]MDQ0683484.1 hypothetical protein [Streptomyces achromogenes]MDQ0830668.1 hypothetical protein [Streptomyces achromogenes]
MAGKKREPSSGENWGPDPLNQEGQEPPQEPNRPPDFSQRPTLQRPPPESYMTPAILVTLLCFLPTGIAAIVFASQVSAKNTSGDYEGAVQSSRKARILVLVSVGVGVVFWLFMIIAVSASDSSAAIMPGP